MVNQNCTEQSDPGPSVQVQMNTSNLSKLVGVIEDSAQTTTKLKLQLFPVDECTRKTLEMVRLVFLLD